MWKLAPVYPIISWLRRAAICLKNKKKSLFVLELTLLDFCLMEIPETSREIYKNKSTRYWSYSTALILSDDLHSKEEKGISFYYLFTLMYTPYTSLLNCCTCIPRCAWYTLQYTVLYRTCNIMGDIALWSACPRKKPRSKIRPRSTGWITANKCDSRFAFLVHGSLYILSLSFDSFLSLSFSLFSCTIRYGPLSDPL